MRPEPGLCLPCEVLDVRDGDTIVVRTTWGNYHWAIRLLDCWCKEKNTAEGKAAKKFTEACLEAAESVWVHIPVPSNTQNLLKNLTFDRLLGWVWVSETETLNNLLVANGFATTSKE